MKKWNFEILNEIPEDFINNASVKNVFFQPPLLKAWLDTYIPLRNLKPIYLQASSDSNEVFFPLVLWKRNWKNAFLHSIIPIGFSDYDYHNPIFKNQPSTDELDSFWNEIIDFLKLNFRFDNITFDGITDSFISKDFSWSQNDICPSLDLRDIKTEDDLMKFFSTSLRGDIRRQIRRLNEIGYLSLVHYNTWEEIPENTFIEFLHQHSLKWPNAYKAPKFHENLLKEGLKSGLVDFSVMKVGEKEIAWHLGFRFKGRYYYYMPAGHSNYLKFSPVKIHLFNLVKEAIENGYEVFDHLRGEENYKSGWSNEYQYVNSLRIETKIFTSEIKHKMLKIRNLITPPHIR